MTLNPAYIRNAMRYVAGALVARGLIGADTGTALAADPVVFEALTVITGGILAMMTESVYALAKRAGWRT